jgi:hypothetical protein
VGGLESQGPATVVNKRVRGPAWGFPKLSMRAQNGMFWACHVKQQHGVMWGCGRWSE